MVATSTYQVRVKVAAQDAAGATLATSAYATTAAFTPTGAPTTTTTTATPVPTTSGSTTSGSTTSTTLSAPGTPTWKLAGTVSSTGTVPVAITWGEPTSVPANTASLMYTLETSTNGGASWTVQLTASDKNTANFASTQSRTLQLSTTSTYQVRVKVAAQDAAGATLATSGYATSAAFKP
jgi:titin